MLDGYLMSEPEFRTKGGFLDLISEVQNPASWKFQDIETWMKSPTERYLKQLKIAGKRFFKFQRKGRVAKQGKSGEV